MQSVDVTDTRNQPLLTIAIPTYNRASFLDLCLKRISEEITSLSKDYRCLIAVYVSDNASVDNTSQVISKYQSLNLQDIQVVRNDINIGGDKNIAQCYESVTSPYIWILGDDDVILPNCLAMVLDILLKQEIDLMYVNNYWFKDHYTEKSIHQIRLGVSNFNDSLAFARRTHVMLTFISALIARTGIGLEFRNSLISSNLVQFSWILPLLRDGKCFVVLENEVVGAKGGNSGGYELVKVFGNNLKNITDSILKDQPKVAKAIQNGTIIKFFPGFIMEFRKGASQFTDDDMAVGLHKVFCDNWRYYVFLLPLIRLPFFFANLYNKMLYVLNRLLGSCLI